MKKAIMILSFVLLALMVLVVAGVASVAVIGKRLDKESKAFVDAAVPAIVAGWDAGEIQKRASPEFNEAVDYDELEELFSVLQRLGKFREYKGSTGEANITISFQHGFEIIADYLASADFEAGSAEIQIALIKHEGQWQILDFQIGPEAALEKNDVI